MVKVKESRFWDGKLIWPSEKDGPSSATLNQGVLPSALLAEETLVM